GEIVVDTNVLVKRIVLKHHGDVAILGRQSVHNSVADADFTGADILKPGNHAQSGRLSAAGGPDQGDEFLVGDGKIHVFHRVMDLSVIFVDFAEYDFRHFGPSFRTEPAAHSRGGRFAAVISQRC